MSSDQVTDIKRGRTSGFLRTVLPTVLAGGCIWAVLSPLPAPPAEAQPATGVTSPAVLHLVNRWNCRRTRAQLGLDGPWAVGQFRPQTPCGETCAARYGLPDRHQGQPVRWELAPGASPHSRGALPLLETLLASPGDPLLANGQVEHRGSDALAEQDLALLHCGQTPVYTWLANRLAVALGGRSAIISHREGDTLAVDATLRAALCEPCEWTLTVHRMVEPTNPWDSGRRRHRLTRQGDIWDLDLPPEWVGADAVVQVAPVGEPRRGSAPINLKLVAGTGDGGTDDGGTDDGGTDDGGTDDGGTDDGGTDDGGTDDGGTDDGGTDDGGTDDGGTDDGGTDDGGTDDLCEDALDDLEQALRRARQVCPAGG